jgi:hypothetical protein
MATIAALESLPQLYAGPLASLAFRNCVDSPWPVFVSCAVLPAVSILLLWACVPRSLDGSAPTVAVDTRGMGAQDWSQGLITPRPESDCGLQDRE